jgi:hypothetical protein
VLVIIIIIIIINIIIIIIIINAGFLWEDLVEKDHLEYLDIDGRAMLKWIFKKWNWET